tara:strand:- start:6067 stop:6183 length:117 start_codon:yes stop_codon:yes gene_type:complete
MEEETEKLRAELEEFVSNCNDEKLLEEMLKTAKDYYSK